VNVSPLLLSVMRTSALQARVFHQSETNRAATAVVVLSYLSGIRILRPIRQCCWRTISWISTPYNVIGVMSKRHAISFQRLTFTCLCAKDAQLANRTTHDFSVVGRLRQE